MSEPLTLPDGAGLLPLLAEQRDLYRQLQELSQRQRALICGERPELLLDILRDRQVLVTALVRLNERLAPFRRHWDALYARLPADARAQASTLLSEINAILRVVLQSDQEDGALLSARQQVVAQELNEISDAQTAHNAYARQAAGPDRSISADLTG